MQLNEIRKELRFNTELVQLIETLKNIAASQYHAMEREKERFDDFMNAFSGFFRVVNLVQVEDPLVKPATDVLGIVVITSDSGFMGGLNQGVIRRALAAQGELPNDKVALVIIGDKGNMTFSDMDRQFKFFPGIGQETIYEQSVQIKDYIVQEVLARRMGRVTIVYPRPLSFSAQTVEQINILPCAELFDKDAESEVSHRLSRNVPILAEARRVIVESSFSAMVEYLSGTWVASKLFEVFEDSKLAEFSARAMHLEGSFQKLQKEQKRIKHMFFKAAHEQIDKGMRESFASRGKTRKKQKAQRAAAAAA
jgi:ATP synthase F1 gamma subunit